MRLLRSLAATCVLDRRMILAVMSAFPLVLEFATNPWRVALVNCLVVAACVARGFLQLTVRVAL